MRRLGTIFAVLIAATVAVLLVWRPGQESAATDAGADTATAARPPAPDAAEATGPAAAVLVQPEAVEDDAQSSAATPSGPVLWAKIRGRVTTAPRERPVGGAVVVLAVRDGQGVRLTCDADGRFETELEFVGPAADAVSARALPTEGLVAPPAIALSKAQLFEDEEVHLRLIAGRSQTFAGTLVYERSRDPITHVVVALSQASSGLEERVAVDDGGRFASTIAFPAGRVEVRVLDALQTPPTPEEKQSEPQPSRDALGGDVIPHLVAGQPAGPHTIELNVGPLLALAGRTGGPLPGGAWVARIVQRPAGGEWAGALSADESGIRDATHRLAIDPEVERTVRARKRMLEQAGFGLERDVRDALTGVRDRKAQEWSWRGVSDAHELVRWPTQEHEPRAELVPYVEVRGMGWVGEAPLVQAFGRHAATVGIDLRPTAWHVQGSVQQLGGTPLPGIAVVLEPVGAEDGRTPLAAVTDELGGYAFVGAPTGSWDLVVQPQDRPGSQERVTLRQEFHEIPPILLPAAGDGGHVTGSLVVPPNVLPPLLELRSTEGSAFALNALLSGRRGSADANRTLRFSFKDVPFGRYELIARGIGGKPSSWQPVRQPVRPPATGLTVRHAGGSANDAVLVRAVDRDGEPVPHARIWFGPDGDWFGGARLDRPRTFDLPQGPSTRWTVTAPGFRPTRGDGNAIRREGDRLVLETTLRSGWGATLLLRHAPEPDPWGRYRSLDRTQALTGAPIRGVDVEVDGRFARRSDADGVVRLEAADAPELIRLRLPGWRIARVRDFASIGIDRADLAVVWLVPQQD